MFITLCFIIFKKMPQINSATVSQVKKSRLKRNYKHLMSILCMSRYFSVWLGEIRRECRRENRKKVSAIWAQSKMARLPSVEFMNYYNSWCNNSTVHWDWNTVL